MKWYCLIFVSCTGVIIRDAIHFIDLGSIYFIRKESLYDTPYNAFIQIVLDNRCCKLLTFFWVDFDITSPSILRGR